MGYQVFISYRRDGGEALAQLINDKLSSKGLKTFYDVESMRSGKFNEEIFSVIDSCKDVVVVLPPNGLDRCSNEDDWVRKEIAYAIKKHKNIVPVMMRDFEFPEFLPQDIDDIRKYHGIKAHMDLFDASIKKLMSLIKSKPKKPIIVSIILITIILFATMSIYLLVTNYNNNNLENPSENFSQTHDNTAPIINISSPSFNTGTIESGTIEFSVSIEENSEFISVKIDDTLVETIGFTADMDVIDQGRTQVLRFSNLKKNSDKCYITLLEGVAKDAANNQSSRCSSQDFYFDTTPPIMSIGAKDTNKIVKEGDTAVYNVAVSDDDIVGASLRKDNIIMHGFIADITIKKKPDTVGIVWEVAFSNIKFNSDSSEKYFEISEGIAADFYGNINTSLRKSVKTK